MDIDAVFGCIEFWKSELSKLYFRDRKPVPNCMLFTPLEGEYFVDFASKKLISHSYSNIAQGNFARSLIKRKLNNSTIICLNGEKDISRLTIFINRT